MLILDRICIFYYIFFLFTFGWEFLFWGNKISFPSFQINQMLLLMIIIMLMIFIVSASMQKKTIKTVSILFVGMEYYYHVTDISTWFIQTNLEFSWWFFLSFFWCNSIWLLPISQFWLWENNLIQVENHDSNIDW